MYLSGESLIVILIVGVVAGWLAGMVVQGTGFGLISDLLIGIVGAFMENGCCLVSASISASASRRQF